MHASQHPAVSLKQASSLKHTHHRHTDRTESDGHSSGHGAVASLLSRSSGGRWHRDTSPVAVASRVSSRWRSVAASSGRVAGRGGREATCRDVERCAADRDGVGAAGLGLQALVGAGERGGLGAGGGLAL